MDTVSAIIPATPSDLSSATQLAHRAIALGADEVVISLADGGAAHARNLGVARATGDILTFMDADVWIGGSLRFDGPHVAWTPRYVDLTGDTHTAREAGVDNFLNAAGVYPRVICGSVAVRRDSLQHLGGWDVGAVFEEVDLCHRLRSLRLPWGMAPFTVYIRRRMASAAEEPLPHATSYGKAHPAGGSTVIYRADSFKASPERMPG